MHCLCNMATVVIFYQVRNNPPGNMEQAPSWGNEASLQSDRAGCGLKVVPREQKNTGWAECTCAGAAHEHFFLCPLTTGRPCA